MYLLFYSKYCKYSKLFQKTLNDMKEDVFFKAISVDKSNGKRHPLVAQHHVKEVPTIVVNGKKYIGQDAFKWLQNKIKSRKHEVSSQDTRQNKNVISGFSENNMSQTLDREEHFDGTSSYASLSTQFSIQTPEEGVEVEKPTFVLPNDSLTGGVEAPPGEQKKDKTNIAYSQFDKLQAERDLQDKLLQKPRRL